MHIAVDHNTILNTLQEQKNYNFVQTSELTKDTHISPVQASYGVSL